MRHPRFIEIDGRRYAWRHILDIRRRQIEEAAKARQLFDLKEDRRPASERSVAGRYQAPTLFTLLE